jgi:hypothetical protein
LTRDAGVSSLYAYLDGDDDVENLIKCLSRPGRTTTIGTGNTVVASPHDVSIRDESNLKLSVFYLKHQERVYCKPTVGLIDLALVHGFRDQQKWEENFNKTAVEPVFNDNSEETSVKHTVFLMSQE